MDTTEWFELLLEHPEKVDECPCLDDFGPEWVWLLERHPQLADRCDMSWFDGYA